MHTNKISKAKHGHFSTFQHFSGCRVTSTEEVTPTVHLSVSISSSDINLKTSGKYTNRDTVVVGVPDHLILNLLPALERLVYQDLGGVSKGLGDKGGELLAVVGEARAQSSQGESRAYQHRIAQPLRCCYRL